MLLLVPVFVRMLSIIYDVTAVSAFLRLKLERYCLVGSAGRFVTVHS